MNEAALRDFTSFLFRSPTAWHAVSEIAIRLAQQDFTPLDEKESWELDPGKSYFIQRGGSLCAFTLPKEIPKEATILASHTDSPALKLKPHPLFIEEGHPFLRVETYGGPILKSWLNRDLAIAGRVFVQNRGEIEEKLLFLEEMPVMIPELAIHLDKSINEAPKPIDKEEHLCPLIGLSLEKKDPDALFYELISQAVQFEELLGFDLFLVPIEPPRLIGKELKLLSSYRLDNLVSAHASLLALLAAKPAKERLQMAMFWNYEEVGSGSDEGASSPFFLNILKRIHLSCKQDENAFLRLKASSRFISIDNAHAFHPQYKKMYDKANTPKLGKGVVIKYNANQRYARNGLICAELISLCMKEKIPFQEFAPQSNIPGGSTLGTLTATQTGIPAIDIGIPQLSMHAARELIASEDHSTLCRLLKTILEV